MFLPNEEHRYFTLGVDNNILTSTPLYSAEEYEQQYPLMVRTMPEMFSINLREDIAQFMSCIPPLFDGTVHEAIDLACFYYSDWDSVVAVADDYIQAQWVNKLRENLTSALEDLFNAEAEVQRQIEMVAEALRKFISVIISVLSRCNVPAIMDFGSCYRLARIDDFGNVFFKMEVPSAVHDAVENACLIPSKLADLKEEITATDDLPGNY